MENVRIFILFFFICGFGLLHSAKEETLTQRQDCSRQFHCGKLGELKFPFTIEEKPDCGLLTLKGCNDSTQHIQLKDGGRWFEVTNISQSDSIFIRDEMFSELLESRNCKAFKNLSFPIFPYLYFQINSNQTLFKCSHKLRNQSLFEYQDCNPSTIYYARDQEKLLSRPSQCSIIQLPWQQEGNITDIFKLLTASFTLEVRVHWECRRCFYRGGGCKVNNKGNYYCSIEKKTPGLKLGLGLGLGTGVPALLLLFYVILRCYKKRKSASNFLSSNSFSHPSSRSDVEGGSVYYGVPLFSYTELEEATSNFDTRKELGDGGFGTVYYGKLKDGREVAVKRLYEHNYKRVEQFMNEVEILRQLRHKNLVTLYGCTSRRSRELLLVYEYIPNGTVADHLHGDRAKTSPLTWSVRMSIAVETASALAYLHASDTIHRDVKSTNILLDSNFCVKVADFGLSRLFPNNVTHVSTAPQGTPGYVDPEYHLCYQLTDKSDVYSFGVVLIELISSMPAVDISRHRHEINLAHLAQNKIQNGDFDELIDPSIGYKSDKEVTRMTILVAELAFRCLQQDKELRPSMDEVLEELNRIKNWEHEHYAEEVQNDDNQASTNMMPPASPPYCIEASLLKNMRIPPSPDTVTAQWPSSCSTASIVSS